MGGRKCKMENLGIDNFRNILWRGMDNLMDMDELNTLWEEGNAKWKIWE